MSKAYYYEGVDPDALLDTMEGTYGYNRSEEETIRDSEGYSVNSYSEETDELEETQQTEDGYAPNIELHEEAYSQTALDTTPSVDERLLTGRYQTNDHNDPTRRVQEPLPEEPDRIKDKDAAALFDWNKKFQDAVESKQGPEKYRMLSSTARDFVFVATTYGRIIISEAPLPIEQKTIKPSSLGGIAGGEKYLVKGILFKFAVDTGKIYGGDENAQKAASSELKGLSSCYMAGVEGLHFPLMALIHYMGYCLIALSTLPLGPNTLKYGSANAGKVVHDDDTHLSALMKTLGGKLNLKGHWAGVPSHSSQKKFLYMPCDIEGHKGNDGKFYMLDFSRVFPPEAILPGSPPQQGALFFRHLRPELVINNDRPLSSDAFCGFGLVDPDRKEHNAEVLACTKRLLEEVIPNFAERLKTFDMNSLPKLKALLHSEGINVRHLGFLRTKVGDHAVSTLVLIEMIARVFKNKLKNKWRKIVGQNLYITEDKCINAATDMLNLLICSSVDPEKRKKYEIYWNNKLKILLKQKFRFALSEDESKEDFDLLSLISSKSQFNMLLKRVLEITGITLTPSANANWTSIHRPHEFQFLNCDISMLDPIVKHTPIIEQADISILFTRGLEAGGQEAQRLLSVAIAKITQNYGTFLFPHEQLRTFGNLIAAKCNGASPADLSYLKDFGSTCFTTALQLKPNSIPILRDFAQFLTIGHEINRACEQLIKASNLDPFDYTIKNQIMRLEVNAVIFNHTDDLLNSTATLAKDSLALNPKQGEPYFWWAYAILRRHAVWKNPVQQTGGEVLRNGGWNEGVVEDVADKIKSGLDLEPSKLDILSRFFPAPRAAILYTLVKVPELGSKIDKDVKHLIVPTFVQNDFLEQLPVFTHLETITIEAPEAQDSGVIRLIQGSSQTLTKVILSNTKITLATLQELAKCPNLEWLSLDNCQFTENPFKELLALLNATQVTQLFVKNVPHLTEQQIGELIAVHPMTRLGFRKTDILTVGLFEVLQQVPNLATSLIRLDIENFDQLTVDHVLSLLKTFQSLKALSILDCAGIEVPLVPHTMSFNHPALEELIMPLGYPLLFTGSHNDSVKFSTVVANAHHITSTNETPLVCVEPEKFYREYNSRNWVFKRNTFGMRVLELQHNNQTVIWVDKIPPGDRFRVLMMGKNGNPLLGDVNMMSSGPLTVSISSLKINIQMNAATSFFVPLSPNMQLVFNPQDARINLMKGGMNVIFHIIAAFLVGSKIKRML